MHQDTVLMIAATPFFSDRGSHIRIYSEITHLSSQYSIALATYPLGKDIPNISIYRIVSNRWYKKIAPGFSWHKLYLDPLLFFTCLKLHIKLKPKIIHAHQYESLLIAFLVKMCTFSGAPILFDCQGSLNKEMEQYYFKKNIFHRPALFLLKLIEKILLIIPAHIVCSSQQSLKYIVKTFKINLNKISIVEDGFDETIFNSTTISNRNQIKEKLSIPVHNKVILYTGSMDSAKGIGEYLNSLPDLISQHPDYTFLFVGYGSIKEKYEKKFSDFIKSKNIVFAGRVSYFNLPEYIACADIAVDPKKDSTEASGKMINYVASGIKIAAFEVPYPKLNGIVSRIKSFDELTDVINSKQNPTDSFDLKQLSWKSTIEDLKKVYISLLS